MKSDDINRMAGNLFHAYDIRIDRDDLSDEYFLRLCDAEASYFLNELKANEVALDYIHTFRCCCHHLGVSRQAYILRQT